MKSLFHASTWLGFAQPTLIAIAQAFLHPTMAADVNLPLAGPFGVVAESHFDEAGPRPDGWSAITVHTWDTTFGSTSVFRNTNSPVSGGYLSFRENVGDGRIAVFSAPAKYLGDQHRAYGGLIEWDLRQYATTRLIPGIDLSIHSGTNHLGYFTSRMPDLDWHHYTARLHESAAWYNLNTHERATAAELVRVLGNLELLCIRREFSHDPFEATDMDNVVLSAPLTSFPQSTLRLETYAGLTLTGEIGDPYRIEAAPDLAGNPGVWAPVADIILPQSPFLWIDPTPANGPRRFYRASAVPFAPAATSRPGE